MRKLEFSDVKLFNRYNDTLMRVYLPILAILTIILVVALAGAGIYDKIPFILMFNSAMAFTFKILSDIFVVGFNNIGKKLDKFIIMLNKESVDVKELIDKID